MKNLLKNATFYGQSSVRKSRMSSSAKPSNLLFFYFLTYSLLFVSFRYAYNVTFHELNHAVTKAFLESIFSGVTTHRQEILRDLKNVSMLPFIEFWE